MIYNVFNDISSFVCKGNHSNEFENKALISAWKIISKIPVPSSLAFRDESFPLINAIKQGFSKSHLMTSKLIGHILGDSFISKTSLEGEDKGHVLEYILPLLEEYQKEYPDPKLKNLTANLAKTKQWCDKVEPWVKDARELYDDLTDTRASREEHQWMAREFFLKFKKWTDLLPEVIQQIKPPEKVIIPGGWGGLYGGHVVMYIIEKAQDGSYTFSLVNSGAGLQYHKCRVVHEVVKYDPLLVITKIDPAVITHPDFCFSLMSTLIPINRDGYGANYDADELYGRIISALQGEIQPISSKCIKPQRSGTCSWQSLAALLRCELGERNYKRLMLYIKGRALRDFSKQKLEIINDKNLLRRSAEKYASYLYKCYVDGYCDEAELLHLKELPKQVLLALDKEQEGLNAFSAQYVMTEATGMLPSPTPITPISLRTAPLHQNPFPEIALHSAKDILPQLKSLVFQIHALEKQGNPKLIVDVIEAATVKLVLVANQENFWTGLDAAEVNEIAPVMDEMRQSLWKSFLSLSPYTRNTMEYVYVPKYLRMLFYRMLETLPEKDNLLHFIVDSKDYAGIEEIDVKNENLAWMGNPQRREALRILINFNKEMAAKKNSVTLNDSGSCFYFKDKKLEDYNNAIIWKKLLSSKEVQDKLKYDYPSLAAQPDDEVLKVLYPDLKGKYLPSHFCLMRNLYYTDKIFSGTATDIQLSADFIGKGNYGKLSLELNPITSPDDLSFSLTIEKESGEIERVILSRAFLKGYHFSNETLKRLLLPSSLKINKQYVTKWSTKPNEAAIDPDDPPLAMIGTSPRITTLQIMDYMKSHRELMGDLEYQQFFLTRLFYEGRLDKNIETSVELRRSWINFLEAEHKRALEFDESSQALFYLYMLRMTPEGGGRAIAHFREMQERAGANLALRAQISAQLIAALGNQKHFTPDMALEIITNFTFWNAMSNKDSVTRYLNREIESASTKAFSYVSGFETAHKLKAAEWIYQQCHPEDKHARHWEAVSAYRIKMKEKDISMDLSQGTLCVDGKILGGLPNFIASHQDYELAAGSRKVIQTTVTAENQIVCKTLNPTTKQVECFEITYNDEQRLSIRKKVGTKTFDYIPKARINLPISLMFDKTHWIDESEGTPKLLIENSQGVVVAVANNENQSNRIIVKSHPEGHVLLRRNPFQSELKWLQDKHEILIWGNAKVEIPSIGLEFVQKHEKNTSYLVWTIEPSYRVARVQQPPRTLPYLDQFVKVEKGDAEKYLIPRLEIDLDQKNKGGLDPRHAFKKQIFPLEKGKYFALNVAPDGSLAGNNIEENLYLAYLHMAEKKYRKAEEYLSGLYPIPPGGLSEGQEEILGWILVYLSDEVDPSLEMSILSLKLYYIILNHAPNLASKVSLEKAAGSLRSYYSQRIHTLNALTPAEEFFYKQLVSLPSANLSEPLSKLNPEEPLSPYIEDWYKSELEVSLDFRKYPLAWMSRLDDLYYKYADILEDALDPHKKKSVKMQFLLLRYNYGGRLAEEWRNQLLYIAEQNDPELLTKLQKPAADLKLAYEHSNWDGVYAASDEIQTICIAHQKGKPASPEQIQPKDPPTPKPTKRFAKKRLFATHPVAFHEEMRPIINQPLSPQQLLQNKGITFTKSFPNAQKELDESLIQAFNAPKGASKVVQNEFKRTQEGIKAAHAQQKEAAVYHPQKPWNTVLTTVQDIQTQLQKEAMDLERQIIDIANRLPAKRVERAKQELALMGKHTKPLTLDEIIIMCMQRNAEGLEKRNPALNATLRGELVNKVAVFLLQSTRLQRFQRAARLMEDSMKCLDPAEKAEKENLAAEELAQPENIQPSDFEMLVFSYYADMRLWDFQVKLIKELCANVKSLPKINRIVQLIMGSGKTKVILPLLALLLSNGVKVPVVVVPDELFEGNNMDLKTFSGGFLGQEVETFYLSKQRTISDNDLQALALKILNVKLNKSYLMTTPWSVYQLILLKKSLREQLSRVHDLGLEMQYQNVLQVLAVLKEQGIGILDEADSILDILKEVNASVGDKQKVSEPLQEFITDFFTYLNEDPLLADFFSINNKKEATFTDADYTQRIKPRLVSWVMQWMRQVPFMEGQPTLEEQRELTAFFLNDKEIKQVPQFIQRQGEAVQELLASLPFILQELFPTAVRKNPNQHYGLSKLKTSGISIPFNELTKQPKEGSEFSLVCETMLYTMLYASKQSLKLSLLEQYVKELKADAIEESDNLDLAPHQTQAYRRYQARQLTPGKTLFSATKADLEMACIRMKSNPKLKMQIAKDYALREIVFYLERLNANQHHLVNVFWKVIGHSGTLWNQDSYPSALTGDSNTSIDGKTLLALNDKKPCIHVIPNPKSLKHDPIFKILTGYHALVDTGAWFRGVPNSKIAQLILSNFGAKSPLKGVAYINDKDSPPGSLGTFVVLEKGKTKPVLLSESTLKPEERFTYYHLGTGLDLVQAGNGKALVTTDQNMICRDNLQGVRRMRKLDLRQSVDYAIRENTAKLIGGKTLHALLVYFTLKQAQKQELINNRSLAAEMVFQLENYIDTLLDSPALDQGRKNEIHRLLRPLLVKANQKVLVAMDDEVSPEIFVKHFIGKITPYFEQIPELKTLNITNKFWSKVPKTDPSAGLQRFEKAIQLFIQEKITKGLIGDKIRTQSAHLGVSQQTQTQSQTDMQTQVQLESENDKNVSFFGLDLMPQDWNFTETGLFKHRFFGDGSNVGGPPCAIGDYLAAHQDVGALKKVQDLPKFFTANIKLTRNYRDLSKNSVIPGTEVVKPFGIGSKPITLCLLVESKDPGKPLEFYYLHPDEAAFLTKLLAIDRAGLKEVRIREEIFGYKDSDCRLALVHPDFGILHQGREPITTNLNRNEEYLRFTTESKVWSGKLHYKRKELEYLKGWIARVGPDNFEQMFLNVILRLKPAIKRKYPGSVLQKIVANARKTAAKEGESIFNA